MNIGSGEAFKSTNNNQPVKDNGGRILSTESIIVDARRRFIVILSVLGVGQAIVFMAVRFFQDGSIGPWDLGYNLVTIVVMTGIYFWAKKEEKVTRVSLVVILLGFISVFMLSSYTPNTSEVGSYFPLFPLLAFFLAGKRGGLVWFGIFITSFVAYLVLAATGIIHPLSVVEEPFIYVVTLGFYLLMVYFFVDVQEKSQKVLNDQTLKEKQINQRLVQEVVARKKVEAELVEKGGRLEKINKVMVGRELEMVELKKEIAKLKGA